MKINKQAKLLSVALILSVTGMANAGYVEVNSVGDKRESYRVNEVKSSVTDSKVPQKASQDAIYYTPKK